MITENSDVLVTHGAPLRRRELSLLTILPSISLFFPFSLSADGFPGTYLRVTGIDFLKSENCRLHHTDAYNINNLVVRRGKDFQLLLSLSRELKAADSLTLHFSIGKWVPTLWPSAKAGKPQQPPAACSCCRARQCRRCGPMQPSCTLCWVCFQAKRQRQLGGLWCRWTRRRRRIAMGGKSPSSRTAAKR